MSLTVNDSLEDIDLRHIDRWFSFKNSLPTSEFRIGVGEWCEKVQHLFCIKMVEERAAYRNYIQARNPLKRVKVVAGQLQIG